MDDVTKIPNEQIADAFHQSFLQVWILKEKELPKEMMKEMNRCLAIKDEITRRLTQRNVNAI